MALQLGTLGRNAMMDGLAARFANGELQLRSGAQPANCAAASSGTQLATMTLPASPFNSGSGGAITKNGTWSDSAADAAGTVAHYRIFENGGTVCVAQGNVTATGGGGDMEIQNVILAVGQNVTVTGYTLTSVNT